MNRKSLDRLQRRMKILRRVKAKSKKKMLDILTARVTPAPDWSREYVTRKNFDKEYKSSFNITN